MKIVIYLFFSVSAFTLLAQEPDTVSSEGEQLSKALAVFASPDSLKRKGEQMIHSNEEVRTGVFSRKDSLFQKTEYLAAKTPDVPQLLEAKAQGIKQKIRRFLQQRMAPSEQLGDSLSVQGFATVNVTADSIDSLAPDSLRAVFSNHRRAVALTENVPGIKASVIDSINGLLEQQWTGLPEDQRRIAQQYSQQLDQLNQAVDAQAALAEVGEPELPVLERYQGCLEGLQKDWSAQSSLLEKVKNGTLTQEDETFQYLESKLGKVKALEDLKAALPANSESALETLNPLSQANNPYEKLSALQTRAYQWLDQANIQPEEALAEVQSRLDKKKKQYTAVPSLRDSSTWVKKNSLKNQPFEKRLVTGGHFNWHPRPPSLDAAPTLGYRLTKKITAGIALNYRVLFPEFRWKSITTTHRIGIGSYLQYQMTRSLLTHLEGEAASERMTGIESSKRNWDYTVYAGGGWEAALRGKWKIQTLFLYDLSRLHRGSASANNPWTIRVGLQRKSL